MAVQNAENGVIWGGNGGLELRLVTDRHRQTQTQAHD